MKKILSIIGSIAVILVLLTIIGSCVSCNGCSGCSSCSSCSSCNSCDSGSGNGGGGGYYPSKPTDYFYLYANDGSDKVYTIDTNASSIKADYIKREGYTFVGVYSSTIGGEMYFNSSNARTLSPQKDDQLYIRWEVNTYKLKFAVGETEIGTEDVQYGTAQPTYPVPLEVPQGKRFEGWKDANGKLVSDENGTPVTEMLTGENYTLTNADKTIKLTASFVDLKYKVTYDFGEYGTSQTVDVVPNSVLTNLPEVDDTNKNYEFIGWAYDNSSNPKFYDGEQITEDTTLYAIVRKFKELSLMNGDTLLKTERVYDGVTLQLKDVEDLELAPGYGVSDWYTSPTMGGGDRITSVAYNTPYTTLYANVQAITYTATFNTGAGESCEASSVNYTVEEEKPLPAASKQNYEFVGWCTDSELTSTPIKKIVKGTHEDLNLYPKFKGVDVEFILNGRGATLSDNVAVVEYGSSYTLLVPKYEGYLFLGWFDSIAGGVKYTDGKGASVKPLDSTEEITLYAQWAKKLAVNVTVIPASAGTVETEDYYIEGDKVTLSYLVPAGYKMIGWYVGDNVVETGETYEFTMPADDVDITLQLEAKTYTITLDCMGYPEDGDTITVTYGEPYELPVLEKPAYSFIGWYYGKNLLTDNKGKSLKNWSETKSVTVSVQFAELDESNGKLIYDKATLLAVKDAPNEKYQLVFDVDMEGEQWTPFAFGGTIVGNDHTIWNLTVSPTTVGNTGMFTTLSGTVQNVKFENLNVTLTATDYTNSYAVGGVCGVLTGTLQNVTVKSGEIVGGTNYNYAGGLVGSMTGGTLKNCKNYATVTSTSNSGAGGIVARFTGGTLTENENYGTVNGTQLVGGIAGYVSVGGNFSIITLKNEGTINGKERVGGVFGDVNGSHNTGYNDATFTLTLKNLNNSGNIICEAGNAGGIIGRLYVNATHSGSHTSLFRLTASQLINTGNVTGQSYVGGLFGYAFSNDGASNLSGCTSSGTITAKYYVGGFAGKLEYIKVAGGSNKGSTIVATDFLLVDTTRYAYVGGYVGCGYHFSDVVNESSITYTARGQYVGGLAGYLNGTVNNCSNSGKIDAKESNFVGGLVGSMSLGGNNSCITLTNSGDVIGNSYTGGIAGYIKDYSHIGYNDAYYTLTMTNVNNSGKISGANDVGGLIGKADIYAEHSGSHTSLLKITASLWGNTGDVTGVAYVGGLIGHGYSNDAASTITSGKSSGKITAQYYIGGLAGKLENIKVVEGDNTGTVINATGFLLDNTTRLAYVGGYAGYGYIFNNCIANTTDITYTQKGNYVGGIAGYTHGVVSNCTNNGNIIATESNYVGGIAGSMDLYGTQTVQKLTNGGKVSGKDNVGGVAGYLSSYIHIGYNDGTYTLTIKEFTNTGAVSGNNNVGGVIGYGRALAEHNGSHTSKTKITASFITNSGAVTGAANVGGLIGYVTTNDTASTIMESSNTGAVNGTGENVDNLIGYKSNISFVN